MDGERKGKIGTEAKGVRIPFMTSAEQVRRVDDWSFAKRIRTRADAIRQLIELGLAASAEKETR